MGHCCCESHQQGTKIIAILQLVFSIPATLFQILRLIFTARESTGLENPVVRDIADEYTTENQGDETTGKAYAIASIVFTSVNIFLGVLLFIGSEKRNLSKCKVWFIINATLLVLFLLEAIGSFIAGYHWLEQNTIGKLIAAMIWAYFLTVVWGFMKELKEEGAVSPHANVKLQV